MNDVKLYMIRNIYYIRYQYIMCTLLLINIMNDVKLYMIRNLYIRTLFRRFRNF